MYEKAKHILLAIASTAIAFLAVAMTSTASADAYTTSNYGYTGSVTVPPTYGIVSIDGNNRVYMDPRRVCTTRAYRATQDVYARYRIFRWDSSRGWLFKNSRTNGIRLNSGSCGTIHGTNFGVGDDLWGHYSVDVKFYWRKASTRSLLGTKYIDYNGNDYTCFNNTVQCKTGQGWVFLDNF